MNETTGPAHPRSPRDRLEFALRLLERYGLLALIVPIGVFFTFWSKTSDTYLTTANIQVTVANQTVLGIVAIAVIVPLVTNRYDLSVGAMAGLSSVAAAAVMAKHGWSLLPAAVFALALGAVVGAFNGLIITRLRIDSLIGTLGTATLLTGLTTWYTQGRAINTGVSQTLIDFGIGNTLGIPRVLFALLLVGMVVWYLLQHTPFGRYLHAIGSNEKATRLVGARVDGLVFSSFVVGGVLSSIAGLALVARTGGATPTGGAAYTLPAFAAAYLGAAAIRPGRFNVWGAIVAIFFLASITSGLNLAGARDYVNDIVNAVALLVGVSLTSYLGRRRAQHSRTAAAPDSEAAPASATVPAADPAAAG